MKNILNLVLGRYICETDFHIFLIRRGESVVNFPIILGLLRKLKKSEVVFTVPRINAGMSRILVTTAGVLD